ncbi:triose-phosphate isomerase family protein [Cryobacterium zhongshanensis]|uniref:Triosephosphate isomerase n=1 Tax=Cryobacterium zhongshanensis TaxID=2928153 RepID=A0AA41QZZ7_9MICO|nr:triose-phosphate isomerase family protein [Cryobacterium zhongshanensis]MCI4659973.1 triose-phosphate isomerase [Cryobacterium zhongshanensis]
MTVRRPPTQYIGVSTKAYFGYERTLGWLNDVRDIVLARPGLAGAGVIPFVIPSDPTLPEAIRILAGTGVVVGAQDVAWGDGALTGEVPATMLAELGLGLVELGHAERRALFGEDDAAIARKHLAAAAAGLTSLLCVGERDRVDPETAAGLCFAQVAAVLPPDQSARVLLAYEPVWAIGAPQPADPGHVNATVDALRRRVDSAWPGIELGIVYGGSAGPGLLADLDAVDGLFLGRFAHDARSLGTVLDEASARSQRSQQFSHRMCAPQ